MVIYNKAWYILHIKMCSMILYLLTVWVNGPCICSWQPLHRNCENAVVPPRYRCELTKQGYIKFLLFAALLAILVLIIYHLPSFAQPILDTALMIASEKAHVEIVKLLLAHSNIDVNRQDQVRD